MPCLPVPGIRAVGIVTAEPRTGIVSMASFKAKQLSRPLVICALSLVFAAISALGVALGQTAPSPPIVSDVPVAGGTERVLFLGAREARALLVLLPGGNGIIGLHNGVPSTSSARTSWCGRSVNGLRKGLPWCCRTHPTERL